MAIVNTVQYPSFYVTHAPSTFEVQPPTYNTGTIQTAVRLNKFKLLFFGETATSTGYTMSSLVWWNYALACEDMIRQTKLRGVLYIAISSRPGIDSIVVSMPMHHILD